MIETRLKQLKILLKKGRTMSNDDELKMTHSSGNVFKDLGYQNADEHLLKAKFAMVINKIG